MFNEYVIVGPSSDPAQISSYKKFIRSLLVKLSKAMVNFVSRGDFSGTHKKEWRYGTK